MELDLTGGQSRGYVRRKVAQANGRAGDGAAGEEGTMNTMLNQVADGVRVRQSAWVWSNAIAVRGEGGLILVDPGIDGSELNQLADDLDGLGLPVGRNRPTCVWVKTGSPASTSRTWSRPDPQPDELSASSRHGRHPLVARTAVSSAPSGLARTPRWSPDSSPSELTPAGNARSSCRSGRRAMSVARPRSPSSVRHLRSPRQPGFRP